AGPWPPPHIPVQRSSSALLVHIDHQFQRVFRPNVIMISSIKPYPPPITTIGPPVSSSASLVAQALFPNIVSTTLAAISAPVTAIGAIMPGGIGFERLASMLT